ncbi:MAG: Ig-like domain-containing protein [Methanobacterium sp.]
MSNRRKALFSLLFACIFFVSAFFSVQGAQAASEEPLMLTDAVLSTIVDNTSNVGESVNGASNVPLKPTIKLVFNKNVVSDDIIGTDELNQPVTVWSNNQKYIHLEDNGCQNVVINIERIVTDTEKRHIFITPVDNLLPGTAYTIVIDPELISKSGITLGNAISISFTTTNGVNAPEAPSFAGAELSGDSLVLFGLPTDAVGLQYRVAADGTNYGPWDDLSVSGTSASISGSGIIAGTSKVEVRVKANGETPAGASAICTVGIYPFGAEVSLASALNFPEGITVVPGTGTNSTVKVRKADLEVPCNTADGKYWTMLYFSRLQSAGGVYGFTLKGDVGDQAILTFPVNAGLDTSKAGIYYLDLSKPDLPEWVYQKTTDRTEPNKLKITVSGYNSQGQDYIYGVFCDNDFPEGAGFVGPIVGPVVGQTENTIVLPIRAQDESGIAKFVIAREEVPYGGYASDEPVYYATITPEGSDNPAVLVSNVGTNVAGGDYAYRINITDTNVIKGSWYNYKLLEVVDNLGNIRDREHNQMHDDIYCSTLTDEEIVALAKEHAAEDGFLNFQFASGDSADSVTQDFMILGKSWNRSCNVYWTSDHPEVLYQNKDNSNLYIGSPVTVHRPANATEVKAYMTVHIESGSVSDTLTLPDPLTIKWPNNGEVFVGSITDNNPVEMLAQFQEAINNSSVNTIILNRRMQFPEDNPFEIDCKGKTIKFNTVRPSGYDAESMFITSNTQSTNVKFSNAVIDASGYAFNSVFKVTGKATLENLRFQGCENSRYVIRDGIKTELALKNSYLQGGKQGTIFMAPQAEHNSKVTLTPMVAVTGCTMDGCSRPGYAALVADGSLTLENNTITGYQGNISTSWDTGADIDPIVSYTSRIYKGIHDGSPSVAVFVREDGKITLNGNTISNCDNGVEAWSGDTVPFMNYEDGTGYSYTDQKVNVTVNGNFITDETSAKEAGDTVINNNTFNTASGGNTFTASDTSNIDNRLILYRVIASQNTSAIYTVTVADNADYTLEEKNGIKTITIKDGVNGFKFFDANITPVKAYHKSVVAVFVQLRNNIQISLGASLVDANNPSIATSGFNVQPGDVLKIYIVDELTNAKDHNPIILQ